jgi:methylated-DNA-protein-cysteine methyltransferase-like protein
LNACYQRIYEIVRDIPYGKVMTYGQIAGMVTDVCTSPVPSITVGRAMANCGHYAPDIPWWRVIGKVGDYGVLRKRSLVLVQHELLLREGVVPDSEERYDLAKYQYFPEM